MNPKYEQAALREYDRIYRDCSERVAAYTRWKRVSSLVAWILIIVAFLLCSFERISPKLGLLISLLGGFTLGLSLMFAISAKQMPLLVRYTKLQEEEIVRRLEELQDA